MMGPMPALAAPGALPGFLGRERQRRNHPEAGDDDSALQGGLRLYLFSTWALM